MSDPIRVLVADDQALLRGSFRLLIDSEPGFTVVAEADNGRTAVDAAREHKPDVVLMDVRMPEMDGIEATKALCDGEATSAVKVLILTMFDLDAYVFAALRAGASGFLLKDIPPADLLRAVSVVADGESLLAPAVTRRLITEFCRRPEPATVVPSELSGLTAREREVLVLVAKGLSNPEIARHLHVSTATVKTHLAHLLDKLDARDRIQLVIIAYETGLISPAR
ncbi:LuxR family two component transcriptional regulator [Herbihabitans rhizosphaerae]|uniref:LuxR family two component transcriptional regulator n=1 Tax=Herbihabitans rhizosphaerae TaxID=1872711 RepID=A0A4Q7KFI4_9PSEU|nr:response regulator transcription factor [Herbihabitans rhizosphaerae]RZS33973.1 LuxR family two component transcriptional regulator [Herbihabitans rhizosphaerae]